MRKIDFNEILAYSSEAYNFIRLNDINRIPDGRYFFSDDIYVNIETYLTRNANFCRFESHKKYVDIQYIISGKEIISIKPVCELTECSVYDVEKDVTFYLNNSGNEIILCEGEGLVLEPGDGHMPCINSDHCNSSNVRKMVIKVPVKLLSHKNTKHFVMDVDGTLTDGKIYMGNAGEAMKAFNIKDGAGIHDLLIPAGITPVIITGRTSKSVEERCKELGISELYQGVSDKLRKLKAITDDFSTVAYIGDDINDLKVMAAVKEAGGVIGCPRNAVDKVKAIADFVSIKNGGDGAVRDFIEWLV